MIFVEEFKAWQKLMRKQDNCKHLDIEAGKPCPDCGLVVEF